MGYSRDVLTLILSLIVVGAVVGALGRLALPGPDPMTIPQTIGIGVAGSLIAGLLARLVFNSYGAPLVLAVLVTTGLVYLVRRSRGGSVTSGPARTRVGR